VPHIAEIIAFLERFAPLELAEDWDNVGLLLGDRHRDAPRVLTCLTLTPDVAREAIGRQVALIVAHHPILFHAVKRLTADDSEGRMLLDLIAEGIAVYSPHTAYDSAAGGINQQLAQRLGLEQIEPLVPRLSGGGSGRMGLWTVRGDQRSAMNSLGDFIEMVKTKLQIGELPFAGDRRQPVSRVAIACGSGGEFLSAAINCKCDVLLTGETRFHTCLEARGAGIGLVLAGHYATERPGLEHLAAVVSREFPDIEAWASEVECDPLQWRSCTDLPPAP
jgi:dinuclear metal center YbgI/SA1388 family protein